MPWPSVVAAEQIKPSCLLLDARRGAELFAQGHLRSALHADLDRCLSLAGEPGQDPARGGRHPLPGPERWAAQLGAWGIGPDTWVVAYDGANGGDGATRLWWMLRAFGHARASVLDGGYQAGVAAGLGPETGSTQANPAPPYPGDRWLLPTVDLETVDRLRLDPAWKILDVRAAPRYRGEVEPFDPIAGHIPGALNLAFAENLEADGRFRSPEALRERYLAFLDGTPPERLVVHCGSGVTACHTLLALDRAGLPGASLYVGSWSEWCRSDRPREPPPGRS
jgi:thiosulfate/3-mercaptopyruvate sulfurtransferase